LNELFKKYENHFLGKAAQLGSGNKGLSAYETANFSINCFGYGEDHNEDQLKMISDKKQGNFYFVETKDDVEEAFIDCLGGILSAMAKDATIELRLKQHVQDKHGNLKPSKLFPEIMIKKVFGDNWKGESEIKRSLD